MDNNKGLKHGLFSKPPARQQLAITDHASAQPG